VGGGGMNVLQNGMSIGVFVLGEILPFFDKRNWENFGIFFF